MSHQRRLLKCLEFTQKSPCERIAPVKACTVPYTEHGTSQATRTSSSCIRPCLQVQVPPPVPSCYITTVRGTGEVPRIPNAQVTCRPGAPSPAHSTPGEPHSAPGALAKAEICSQDVVCKPQAARTSGLPWHRHQQAKAATSK